MTVVFDLVGAQNRDHGERGIARYVLNLALQVERVAPGLVDRWLVRSHLPIPGPLEPLLTTGRVEALGTDRAPFDIAGGGVFVAGSLFELSENVDGVLPRIFRDSAWRRAAVMYDLIPLKFPDLYLRRPEMRHPYLARVETAKAMDHLLCISAATAEDAAAHLGIGIRRTSVIGAGADERFTPHPEGIPAAVADVVGRPPVPGLRAGYVLNPTGIEPRKNIDRLLDAYSRLPLPMRAAHQLVLQCKALPQEVDELRSTAADLGIVDDLLITGYVGDEDLVRLYRGAHLVVFPSLYEGFGLPVLEAMRCGAAAICSDSSSLKEVQVDPAARFDPTDAVSIADAMARVLGDDAELERIRSLDPPDFTWARAAEGTVATIEDLRRAASTVPRRRPRVALVTPLPPQRSGIATYAARMIEHLAPHVDLTCFVDGGLDEVTPIDGVQIHDTLTFDAIDAGGRPFDRVVTFLGNSSFHVEALHLVRRHGGTVLLHDARLTGLYGEVLKTHPDRLIDGHVGHTVAGRYPHRYRSAVEAQPILPPDMAALSGVHLLAEVAAAADRLLVHSRYAAELCELDTGRRPDVPFAMPCVPPLERPSAAGEATNHRIVSVGIVSPVKQPELLVEAMRIVLDVVPDATLTFVGGGPDDYVEHLRSVIDRAGLGWAVTLTGHVDDDDFESALCGAAVAVQLRAFTNGESSAAVMDVLSAGAPTVVTALGSMAELPDEVAIGVDAMATAAELGGVLIGLLTDPAHRARLHGAACRFASDHGFAAAASSLLEFLDV